MLLVLSLLFVLGASNYTGVNFELLRIFIPEHVNNPSIVCANILSLNMFGSSLSYDCYGQLDLIGNTSMSLYITDSQAVLPLPSSVDLGWEILTDNNDFSGLFNVSLDQVNQVNQLQFNVSGLGQNVTFVYVLSLDRVGCTTLGSSSSVGTTTEQTTTESTTLRYNGTTIATIPSSISSSTEPTLSSTSATTLGQNTTSTVYSTSLITTILPNTTTTYATSSSIASTTGSTTNETTTAPSTTQSTMTPTSSTPLTTVLVNTTTAQNTTYTTTGTSTVITNGTLPYTTTTIQPNTTFPKPITTSTTSTVASTTTITSGTNTTLPTTTSSQATTVSLPNTTLTTSTSALTNSTSTTSTTAQMTVSTSSSNITSSSSSTTSSGFSTEEWTTDSSYSTTTVLVTVSNSTRGASSTTHHGFNHTVSSTRRPTSASSTTSTSITTTTLPTTTSLDCSMCPVGCLSQVDVDTVTRVVTVPAKLFYVEQKKSFTGILIFAIVEGTFIILVIFGLLFLRFTPLGRRYLHLLTGEESSRQERGDIEERVVDRGGEQKVDFHATVSGSDGYEVPNSALNKAGRTEENLKRQPVENDYMVPIRHKKQHAPRPPSSPPPPIPPFRREQLVSELGNEGAPRKENERIGNKSNLYESYESNNARKMSKEHWETDEEERKPRLADTESHMFPAMETVPNVGNSQESEPNKEVSRRDSRQNGDFVAISMENDIVEPETVVRIREQDLPIAPIKPIETEESQTPNNAQKSSGKEETDPRIDSSPKKASVLDLPEDELDYYSDWVNWVKECSPYAVSWTLGFDPVYSRSNGTGNEEPNKENGYSSIKVVEDPIEEPMEVPSMIAPRPHSWPVDQTKISTCILPKDEPSHENSDEEIHFDESESDIVETVPPPLPNSPPPHRRVPALIDFYETRTPTRPDDYYSEIIKPTVSENPSSISFSFGDTEVVLIHPSDRHSNRQEETDADSLAELIVVDTEDGESIFVEIPSDLENGSNETQEISSGQLIVEDDEGSIFVDVSEETSAPDSERSIEPICVSEEDKLDVVTYPFDSTGPVSSAESQVNLAPYSFAIPIDPDYFEDVEEQPFWPEFDLSEYFETTR